MKIHFTPTIRNFFRDVQSIINRYNKNFNLHSNGRIYFSRSECSFDGFPFLFADNNKHIDLFISDENAHTRNKIHQDLLHSINEEQIVVFLNWSFDYASRDLYGRKALKESFTEMLSFIDNETKKKYDDDNLLRSVKRLHNEYGVFCSLDSGLMSRIKKESEIRRVLL